MPFLVIETPALKSAQITLITEVKGYFAGYVKCFYLALEGQQAGQQCPAKHMPRNAYKPEAARVFPVGVAVELSRMAMHIPILSAHLPGKQAIFFNNYGLTLFD